MAAKNDRQDAPGEQAVSAWAKLVRTQTRVLDEVHEALKTAGLPVLAWYDVLYELYKAGDDGLRQLEVGEKTLITKYNLSRLFKKLRQDSLVEIRTCAEDSRSNFVTITDKGTELLKCMWPIYGNVIRERIEESLSSAEICELDRLLDKIDKKNKWR